MVIYIHFQKTQKEEKAGGLEWDVDTEEPNSHAGLEQWFSMADSAVRGSGGAKSVTFYVIRMNCSESSPFQSRAN